MQTSQLLTLRHPKIEQLPHKARDVKSVASPIRKAFRACILGESKWPLFIFGPAGTGKTCAALCLCDCVNGSKFWTEESLVQTITDAMMDRLVNSLGYAITPPQIWKQVESSALVVLDELGARTTVTDHRYATVKSILDLREGKPLAMVSNVEPQELASIYDDRIASRALCGTVVKAGGSDRRMVR